MPVCLSCNAAFEGYVCQKCGSPQHRPGPPLLTGKVMGPAAWLMAGLAAAGVLLGGVFLGLGVSLVRGMMSEAQPPQEGRNHATLALARLLTSTHLELEVLSIDLTKSTVTLRHRKTGSVCIQDLESARNGQFHFSEVADRQAGRAGSVAAVHAPLREDVEAQPSFTVPEWIPAYPLTHPRGSGSEADSGSFGFHTPDATREVISFYQEGLRRSGFQITASGTYGAEDSSTQGTLSATDPSTGRRVGVTISADGPLANVNVTYGAKRASSDGSRNP